MARALAKNPLLLGYPDEEITEEYINQVDFCASKIGGKYQKTCGKCTFQSFRFYVKSIL